MGRPGTRRGRGLRQAAPARRRRLPRHVECGGRRQSARGEASRGKRQTGTALDQPQRPHQPHQRSGQAAQTHPGRDPHPGHGQDSDQGKSTDTEGASRPCGGKASGLRHSNGHQTHARRGQTARPMLPGHWFHQPYVRHRGRGGPRLHPWQIRSRRHPRQDTRRGRRHRPGMPRDVWRGLQRPYRRSRAIGP